MNRILPFCILVLVLSSCVKNNPDPVWLDISAWQLNSNPDASSDPGILTHSISQAWVYVDNEIIGVFELPCKIPVFYAGEKTIKIYPAVLNNGISATKKIYPFLEPFEITTDFVENQTITINPTTRYLATTQFWVEDFEVGSTIENDPTSPTSLQLIDNASILIPSINNGNFGRIDLDDVNDIWIGYTTDPLFLPQQGAEVYLEIDYHNSNRFTTGVLAVGPGGVDDNPQIQLNPQDDDEIEWKKVYIDLKEIVSSSTTAEYFQISFQSLIDDDETTGQINIDNIKVVHF